MRGVAKTYCGRPMPWVGFVFGVLLVSGSCAAQSTAGASISDLPEIRTQRSGPAKPVAVCDDLAKAVEAGVKEMAYFEQSALGTPASEVTNRRLSIVAEASKVQSNLLLMQSNKCPMPKQSINSRAYFNNAFACAHAMPKAGTGPIPECDRSTWVRSSD